jgi:signal transduction histidine kinase
LRQLATYLQDTQEKERTRLARELHDDLAQILTGLTYDISWLTKQMTTVPRPWKERVAAMAMQIEELKKAVHRLGTELRPTVLDDLGLLPALEWQLQQTRRRTGLRYTLHMPEAEELPLDEAQATAMFRIFQEALTNVVRHAEASHVAVCVTLQPDALLLEVTDNGKGITPEQGVKRTSLGLLGMHERATLWGGDLAIQGRPGEGTTIRVRIPYHGPEREAHDSHSDCR